MSFENVKKVELELSCFRFEKRMSPEAIIVSTAFLYELRLELITQVFGWNDTKEKPYRIFGVELIESFDLKREIVII